MLPCLALLVQVRGARLAPLLLATLLTGGLAAAQGAPDTARYVVWNHGREAGELRVITRR